MKKTLNIVAAIILYALIAVALVVLLYLDGSYPDGMDTLCHLYKSDVLYENIANGNWYPYYDAFWYNGVQMMRFWAPLPVYFLALCQLCAGGDLFLGFKLFVAAVFFFGAISWLYIGIRKKRPMLGGFLGILWFFIPNNLHALFAEGNLPRSLSMIFLPLLFYGIYEYQQEESHKKWIWIVLWMLLISLCHSGYAFMVVAGAVMFLFVYQIAYPKNTRAGWTLLAFVCAFAITGIWLIPSLIGGLTSTDSSQTMQGFFQNIFVTLNPVERILHLGKYFYFGLAAFILGLFGIICSHRKSIPGFVTALLILFLTSNTMYVVLSRLPGSQYMWMLRFLSIALCMLLYSFLQWDTLRKPFLIALCVLLVLDVFPSVPLFYGGFDTVKEKEKLEILQERTLIEAGKEVTQQRLACMDERSLKADAAYLISGYGENRVKATFGAGWQVASTTGNIVQLNESMHAGFYPYLFDRCLELGNDTVLVRIDRLKNKEDDLEALKEAGRLLAYEVCAENSGYILFHRSTPETFGVVTEYSMIGIGTSAPYMSLALPAMEETISPNLNDYTFEDLSDYEIVFLNRFTYDNKEQAEQLVRDLSNAGVKVIICADGMPENPLIKIPEFLGVSTSPILFENGFPILYFQEDEVDCNLFCDGYSDWNTVYMNGLDTVEGCLWDHEVQQAFLGTKENENIVFIGLNMTYHYFLTEDPNAKKMLEYVFGEMTDVLPQRQIVPITITYNNQSIVINSEHDNVNTTLAYHDVFESDQPTENRLRLLYVSKGETVVTMKYPYLIPGGLLSGAGIVLTVIVFVCLMREKKLKIQFEE